VRALVIACGNRDRGDDAAGLLVAAALEEAAVPVVVHRGDGLGLLELFRGQEHVVLVDALASPSAPGTVRRFEASDGPLGVELGGTSTHAFGPGGAIELARALGQLPARLEVYTIAGARFGIGDQPAPAVRAAARQVAGQLIGRFG
jgi:hydrogenase maturation protease